jgi:TPR repeat protein
LGFCTIPGWESYTRAHLACGNSKYCNAQDKEAFLVDAKAWFAKAATQQHGAALYAMGMLCKRKEAGLLPTDADGWFARAEAIGYTSTDDTFWHLLLKFCHKPT